MNNLTTTYIDFCKKKKAPQTIAKPSYSLTRFRPLPPLFHAQKLLFIALLLLGALVDFSALPDLPDLELTGVTGGHAAFGLEVYVFVTTHCPGLEVGVPLQHESLSSFPPYSLAASQALQEQEPGPNNTVSHCPS